MKVSEGVCRTPVCRPTSVRRIPLADSSAAAVSASSSGDAEHRVEHGRLAHVVGDPGVRDGHEPEPRVLDPGLQGLGHDDLDPVGQPAHPRLMGSHDARLSSSRPRTRPASCPASVVVPDEPLPGADHLELRTPCHQPLARIEHLPAVRQVGTDHRDPDQCAPVEVQMASLRRRHVEPATQLGHQPTYVAALVLQRADVAGEQQVDVQDPDEHRCSPTTQSRDFSRISNVSITSSTLMSLNDPRPMPHS